MAVLADLTRSNHDIRKIQQEETGNKDRARIGSVIVLHMGADRAPAWFDPGGCFSGNADATSTAWCCTDLIFALPVGRGRERTASAMLQVGTALAVDLSGEEGACAGAALEVAVDARGAFCGATMRAHSAPLHPSSLQAGRPTNLFYPGMDMLGYEGTTFKPSKAARAQERFKSLGKQPSMSVLLYGPPCAGNAGAVQR